VSKVIVRRATREDIASFSDMENKPSAVAWVGVLDDKIIALTGFALIRGRWFLFLDLTEEARKHKITMMRTAKMIMAEAQKQGIKFIYAERDEDEPKSEAWLRSLGFDLDPRSDYYFRWAAWQNSQH
jgi:hypothetical protein